MGVWALQSAIYPLTPKLPYPQTLYDIDPPEVKQ
jgi:hypothetical protein